MYKIEFGLVVIRLEIRRGVQQDNGRIAACGTRMTSQSSMRQPTALFMKLHSSYEPLSSSPSILTALVRVAGLAIDSELMVALVLARPGLLGREFGVALQIYFYIGVCLRVKYGTTKKKATRCVVRLEKRAHIILIPEEEANSDKRSLSCES